MERERLMNILGAVRRIAMLSDVKTPTKVLRRHLHEITRRLDEEKCARGCGGWNRGEDKPGGMLCDECYHGD